MSRSRARERLHVPAICLQRIEAKIRAHILTHGAEVPMRPREGITPAELAAIRDHFRKLGAPHAGVEYLLSFEAWKRGLGLKPAPLVASDGTKVRQPTKWEALDMSKATYYRLGQPTTRPVKPPTVEARARAAGRSTRQQQRVERLEREAPSLLRLVDMGVLNPTRAEEELQHSVPDYLSRLRQHVESAKVDEDGGIYLRLSGHCWSSRWFNRDELLHVLDEIGAPSQKRAAHEDGPKLRQPTNKAGKVVQP
jgi:hypothetical protein